MIRTTKVLTIHHVYIAGREEPIVIEKDPLPVSSEFRNIEELLGRILDAIRESEHELARQEALRMIQQRVADLFRI